MRLLTCSRTVVVGTLVALAMGASASRAGLPEAKPEAVGLDSTRLARIDDAAARAIAEKRFPGAVVLIGRKGKVAYARSFGQRSIEPKLEAMTRDTIFDMASLTKPVATATSMMVLLERGAIRLSDPLRLHLPDFDNHGKGEITIEQLLRHRSGLMADNPLADYKQGPETAWKNLANLPLDQPPGVRFLYSDVNYEILGRIVEKLSGESLDAFAMKAVFRPLGLTSTGFRPIGQSNPAESLLRLAPTEREAGRVLRGEVHDPRARALGGVAGHAGLFSSADDLAVYAQMLLSGGKTQSGSSLLGPLTVRLMTDPGETPPGQRRALGWDVETSFSGPRGALFGRSSYGHTGFTGTSLWIDPETELFVIILTNRVHPDGKGNPGPFRAEVATIAASSLVDLPARSSNEPPARPASSFASSASERPARDVECGIDVLIKRRFRELRNKRVALVTNHTGRSKTGESTIDVLYSAPGVRLVALFSPEHGIRGLVDKEIGDSRDTKTGLPIYSLYGKTRKPSPEQLKDVDVIVYDIQDIGTRFYTYISTLGLVLEAARESRIPLIVLDRPNPVGGEAVAGPVRDPDFASFIAYHALPVRHGMTVGELARLFNAERSIQADLTVIACEGWKRDNLYDRTGLLWVNPSPNMRSLTQAILYPGVGLLEATNLATGRGTDTPFERVGAPYIDARAWASALNAQRLPGLTFVPIQFTPTERQFAGKVCGGVQILITDWAKVEPIDLALAMAITLRKLYPKEWNSDGFLRFLADRDAYEAFLTSQGIESIRATWAKELAEFLRIRARYLLYP